MNSKKESLSQCPSTLSNGHRTFGKIGFTDRLNISRQKEEKSENEYRSNDCRVACEVAETENEKEFFQSHYCRWSSFWPADNSQPPDPIEAVGRAWGRLVVSLSPAFLMSVGLFYLENKKKVVRGGGGGKMKKTLYTPPQNKTSTKFLSAS